METNKQESKAEPTTEERLEEIVKEGLAVSGVAAGVYLYKLGIQGIGVVIAHLPEPLMVVAVRGETPVENMKKFISIIGDVTIKGGCQCDQPSDPTPTVPGTRAVN
jgi:hypothetical protein